MWNIRELKKAAIINLGSTYAYYDFNYNTVGVNGVNMANCPQYLDVDLLLIKKYGKKLKKGTKVLIVLPDFVFAVDSEEESKKIISSYFYLGFSYGKNNLKYFIKAKIIKMKSSIKSILKKNNKSKYPIGIEDKGLCANQRLESWVDALGIPSFENGEITKELRGRINHNIELLSDIIIYCKKVNLQPIIIVPPVSLEMKNRVSRDCLHTYLFEPISIIGNNIPILNYLLDEKFDNSELYWNSDCLNEIGAVKFTERVLKDIESMEDMEWVLEEQRIV